MTSDALNNIFLYFAMPMLLVCCIVLFVDIYYSAKDYQEARKSNNLKEKEDELDYS